MKDTNEALSRWMQRELEFYKFMTKAAVDLPEEEANCVADFFMQIMDLRISTGNQISAIRRGSDFSPGKEPHDILTFFHMESENMEKIAEAILGNYVRRQPIGEWLMSQKGISNRLAAKLLANLKIAIPDKETGDLQRIQTASAWWRFAGLDPTADKLKKGSKSPYNRRLKTFVWQVGDSFIKQRTPLYRSFYDDAKAEEAARNGRGELKDQAEKALEEKTYGKKTEAYKAYSQGRLPDGHIHMRAMRKMEKLFLSHMHEVWYRLEYGEMPPKPYAFAYLGHAHYIEPPNLEAVGLKRAAA